MKIKNLQLNQKFRIKNLDDDDSIEVLKNFLPQYVFYTARGFFGTTGVIYKSVEELLSLIHI